jgi:hypothetical protein
LPAWDVQGHVRPSHCMHGLSARGDHCDGGERGGVDLCVPAGLVPRGHQSWHGGVRALRCWDVQIDCRRRRVHTLRGSVRVLQLFYCLCVNAPSLCRSLTFLVLSDSAPIFSPHIAFFCFVLWRPASPLSRFCFAFRPLKHLLHASLPAPPGFPPVQFHIPPSVLIFSISLPSSLPHPPSAPQVHRFSHSTYHLTVQVVLAPTCTDL